jgi:hypothetical protein
MVTDVSARMGWLESQVRDLQQSLAQSEQTVMNLQSQLAASQAAASQQASWVAQAVADAAARRTSFSEDAVNVLKWVFASFAVAVAGGLWVNRGVVLVPVTTIFLLVSSALFALRFFKIQF